MKAALLLLAICPFGGVDFAGHPRVVCGQVDIGAFERMGDGNCDGVIDRLDMEYMLGPCWTGPRTPRMQCGYPAGCEAFEYVYDGDIDLRDYAIWQRKSNGRTPRGTR